MLPRQIPRSRNPHPLPHQPERHSQQPKDPHDHAEDAKRQRRAVVDHPVGDEERPAESDDRAHDGRHHEAVAVHRVVGVDDLLGCELARGDLHSRDLTTLT